MGDLQDLYQELIIDHSRHPRNQKIIENITHRAEGYNHLCGDKISLQLCVENDIVQKVSFQALGCAISVAAASIMSETVRGLSLSEAMKIFDKFHTMLTEGIDAEMGKLEAFRGVRDFPGRVKCATMSWHTFKSAVQDTESTV